MDRLEQGREQCNAATGYVGHGSSQRSPTILATGQPVDVDTFIADNDLASLLNY